MIVRTTCLAAMLLTATPIVSPAPFAAPATPSRVAGLGDIGSFRSIAADTLVLAEKSDMAAAQKRGTDLETTWDKAEDALKPTDPKRWRVVDKAIDRVLNELRAAQPQQSKIAVALRDLLDTMDKGGAA